MGRSRMHSIEPSIAYRLLYPDVPAIVCSSYNRTVSAMPAVSIISLSQSPPLIGVSCSPMHSTFMTIKNSRCFSLCFLDKSYSKYVESLATYRGKRSEDKLALVGLSHHTGKRVNSPVIDVSSAVIECSLIRKMRFGDHFLLIGKIETAYATQDFKEYWEFKSYKPILYTGWRNGLRTYL